MTRNDTEIVTALCATLADRVGPQRYELWFGADTQLALDQGALVVTVPSRFLLEFIRTNFRRDLESVCLDTIGRAAEVRFRVDPALGETAETPAPKLAVANGSDDGSRGKPTADDEAEPAQNGHGGPRRNGFAPRRFADLDSFVTGDSNRLARASADLVVRRPGELSPLFVHGPTGSGKTHLLEGIWTGVRRTDRQRTVVYLSAEQFTTLFLEALRGSGLPSFRRKYRGVSTLIVDDLQFFCGKRATQVELLYTIDTLQREGRQLVFAADRAPEDLSELGAELTTRLQSGMVCRIEPPEYETRVGIVAHMARRLKVNLPGDVQEFIAAQLRSHARELSGAVCRLSATARLLDRPIDLATAQEALGDMIRCGNRVVRLPDIQKAVCKVFKLEPESLMSQQKARSLSYPRMLAMWLARKHTRAALSEIGQFFGRRSHSTVISAQKRVDGWLSGGEPVELADRTWSPDEAIRELEMSLRAG